MLCKNLLTTNNNKCDRKIHNTIRKRLYIINNATYSTFFQADSDGKLAAKSYHHDRNLAAEREEGIPSDGGSTSEIPSATATIKPPSTRLDDVFISVKTTKHYHSQRLPIILKTWFQLAKAQVRNLHARCVVVFVWHCLRGFNSNL